MRQYTRFTLVLVVIALASACGGKPKTECIFGDKVPQVEFDGISNAAGDAIMFIEGGQWKELYESGTEELKTAQTRDQFKLPLDLFVRSFGPLTYSRILELYYLTSKSREERVMIACNLGEPGIDDIYGMPANRELAVVVFESRADQEQVRVIVTLEKEKDLWKLRSVSLHPASMKNRTPEYYLKTAQAFREKNQLRLAALYYRATMLLLDMGINVNEYSTKVISSQLSQIKVDYLPMGETQMWTMPSGTTYKVFNLDIAYNKGDLLLQVVYYTESLSDQDKLKAQARELAEYIAQNFPEYREGFDGIRVSAVSEKQEETFSTVHHQFLFTELPNPGGAPAPAPATSPGATVNPAPLAPAPAGGATAQVVPAAPAAPVAPAAGSTTPPAAGSTAPVKP